MRLRIYFIIIAQIIITMTPILADLGAYVGLKQLITRSSFIAAGSLSQLKIGKTSKYDTNSWLIATFTIDHRIKGAFSTNKIDIQLSEAAPESIIPNDLIVQKIGKRWLLFLQSDTNQTGASYKLVNGLGGMILVGAYNPSFDEKGMDIDANIEKELLSALKSDDSLVVSQALRLIEEWQRKNSNTISAVNNLAEHASNAIKGQSIAIRISWGDFSVLPLAACYQGPEATLNHIGASIASITNPIVIPELIKIMKTDKVAQKRGAIYALRMLATQNMKKQLMPIFRAALDDSDRDIQYNAIMGLRKLLSGISNERELLGAMQQMQPSRMPNAPARDVFEEAPEKYVNEWKNTLVIEGVETTNASQINGIDGIR